MAVRESEYRNIKLEGNPNPEIRRARTERPGEAGPEFGAACVVTDAVHTAGESSPEGAKGLSRGRKPPETGAPQRRAPKGRKEASLARRARAIACACIAGLLLHAAAAANGQDAAPAGTVHVAELSPETERSIDRALKYLAKAQHADGSWATKYKAAATSLSLMGFMLKGHFPKQGKYGRGLDRAVRFLVQRAREGGGYFGGNMYEHGLGTLALSEVWGMTERKELRDTIKQAVVVILKSQASSGGWRYQPIPRDADISVTVMQIVALSSAREAGIYVPQKTIDRAVKYVKRLQVRFTGGFGYTSPGSEGFARTAAGVMSLLMCGEDADSRAVRSGLSYLNKYPKDKFTKIEWYYYGHYYAVQAMYQAGESYYQTWYPQIQRSLLRKQQSDGSWRSGSAGTEGSTAMAVLILGVPYRFLPIYQR